MNNHPNLETMLRKETTNPNPRQAAAALMQKAPRAATEAVLYSDRHRLKWIVMFVPSDGLPNLGQAVRWRFDGLPAVARAPVSPPHPHQNQESHGSRRRVP